MSSNGCAASRWNHWLATTTSTPGSGTTTCGSTSVRPTTAWWPCRGIWTAASISPRAPRLWGNAPNNAGNTNRMRKLIEYPGQPAHLLCASARPHRHLLQRHLRHALGQSLCRAHRRRQHQRLCRLHRQPRRLRAEPDPRQPAFSITTSNGLNFAANTNLVTLAGTAALRRPLDPRQRRALDPAWPTRHHLVASSSRCRPAPMRSASRGSTPGQSGGRRNRRHQRGGQRAPWTIRRARW